MVIGLLAVAAAAYLAAVFLVTDAHRMADPDLEDYFRGRAILAAVVAGLIAAGRRLVLRADDSFLFRRARATRLAADAAVGRVRGWRRCSSCAGAVGARLACSRRRRSRAWSGVGALRSTHTCCRSRSPSLRARGHPRPAVAGRRRRRGVAARPSVTYASCSASTSKVDSK